MDARLPHLLAATVLCAAIASPAGAALPGRADSADVIRLATAGGGVLVAASPAMDAALGRGNRGVLRPGCDGEGFSYRPVATPRLLLEVDVPPRSRRLDVVLRPVHGLRELTVHLGDRSLGSLPLRAGWQRLSLPLEGDEAGTMPLRLELANPTEARDEGPGMPPTVRALLHALRFSRRAEVPPDGSLRPTPAGDVLWLERGESLELPAPLQAGQALETDGVIATGGGEGLRVRVDLVAYHGGVEAVAELPAALDLPYNVDLSRRNEQTPVFLRLSIEGDRWGAVGLRRPRLTVAAAPTHPTPTAAAAERILVIVAPGLRSDDAAIVGGRLPGAVSLPNAWSTALALRAALGSLWTGLYPPVHGVEGRRDTLDRRHGTLASALRTKGFRTLARAGYLPVPADDALWTGFDDIALAGPEAHRPQAAHVLDATAADLGQGRVFAAVVLTDIAPPYLPRPGDAWRAYFDGAEPAWSLRDTRQILTEVAAGRRTLDDRERRFLEGLRRGKADEVLSAVADFVRQLRADDQPPVRIVVVGLGEQAPGAAALEPDDLQAALWLIGDPTVSADHDGPVDLTDVAATLATWGGTSLPSGGQGLPIGGRLPGAWPTLAFASVDRATELVVHGRYALIAPRRGGAPTLHRRSPGSARFEAIEAGGGQAIRLHLLERSLRAWHSAGARWHEPAFDPSFARSVGYGHPTTCAHPTDR